MGSSIFLSDLENTRAPQMYKQFEEVVKSWETKALGTSELTKNFKL